MADNNMLPDLIKSAQKAQENIKELTKQLEKLKQEGKENILVFFLLTEKLKEAKKTAGELASTIKSLKKQHEELAEKASEAAESLDGVIEVNDELGKSFEKAEKATKKASESVTGLSDNIKDASTHIDSLSVTINTSTATLDKLNNAADSGGDSITDIANTAKDAQSSITELNQALTETAQAEEDASSSSEGTKKGFSDYAKIFKENLDTINPFNEGLGAVISNAGKAGGVGPLVTNSFKGMAGGIKGMGAAISANPIGLFLTILGPIIEKLMSFTPVTRAVEQAMAALSPVLDLVSKPLQWMAGMLTTLIEGFTGLIGSMSDSSKAAAELADAEQKLNTQKALMERANEKAKQQADELIKKSEDQTLSIEERTIALQEAVKVESDNLANQRAIADETYRIELQKLQRSKDLSEEDIKILEDGTAEEIHALMNTKLIKEEELQTLEKAHLEKERLAADETNMIEQQNARKRQLQKEQEDNEKQAVDNAIKRQKEKLDLFSAENAARQQSVKQRMAFENDYAQRSIAILKQELSAKKISQEQYQTEVLRLQTQQRNNINQINAETAQRAITLQKLQLDKYIADQGFKAKTMQEELTTAQEVYNKKAAIIKAEFDASNHSKEAELQRDIALQQAENDIARQRAEVAVDNAAKELQAYNEVNQSKLSDDKFLSKEILTEEEKRLNGIAAKEKEYQLIRLQNNLIDQEEYNAAIKAIDQKNKEEHDNLQAQYDEADKAKKAIDLENKRLADTANMEYDLKYQLDNLAAQKAQELKAAEETGADVQLIEAKYAKMEKDTRKAVMDNKLELANQTFGNLQVLLGKESAAGKAMAVAQATIETYKSAVSAYSSMSGIPIVGPALGAVAAAAAVAAGIANVKKITSTKTPKAEKGALFSIGGKRHSQGGTLFTGEDGTRFEAEAGEVIGVMNRNAARHFMAFNNTFPAGGGSAPNYFASGGIVSREVAQPTLNAEDLANRIAQANRALPAPVVAVEDILTKGNSYVSVRDRANF